MSKHQVYPGIDLKPFQKQLRSQGFRRDSVINAGNMCIQTYSRTYDNGVKVEVQLWGDGAHRATNWHPYKYTDNEGKPRTGPHMATRPTDFVNLSGMTEAINIERQGHGGRCAYCHNAEAAAAAVRS